MSCFARNAGARGKSRAAGSELVSSDAGCALTAGACSAAIVTVAAIAAPTTDAIAGGRVDVTLQRMQIALKTEERADRRTLKAHPGAVQPSAQPCPPRSGGTVEADPQSRTWYVSDMFDPAGARLVTLLLLSHTRAKVLSDFSLPEGGCVEASESGARIAAVSIRQFEGDP